ILLLQHIIIESMLSTSTAQPVQSALRSRKQKIPRLSYWTASRPARMMMGVSVRNQAALSIIKMSPKDRHVRGQLQVAQQAETPSRLILRSLLIMMVMEVWIAALPHWKLLLYLKETIDTLAITAMMEAPGLAVGNFLLALKSGCWQMTDSPPKQCIMNAKTELAKRASWTKFL